MALREIRAWLKSKCKDQNKNQNKIYENQSTHVEWPASTPANEITSKMRRQDEITRIWNGHLRYKSFIARGFWVVETYVLVLGCHVDKLSQIQPKPPTHNLCLFWLHTVTPLFCLFRPIGSRVPCFYRQINLSLSANAKLLKREKRKVKNRQKRWLKHCSLWARSNEFSGKCSTVFNLLLMHCLLPVSLQ